MHPCDIVNLTSIELAGISDNAIIFTIIALSEKYNFDTSDAFEYVIQNVPNMTQVNVVENKRHYCPRCPKTYAGKSGLKQHMDICHPTNDSCSKYICIYCNKKHYNLSNLQRHQVSCPGSPTYIPPNDGKFTCTECAKINVHKAFKQKGNLVTHCKRYHS